MGLLPDLGHLALHQVQRKLGLQAAGTGQGVQEQAAQQLLLARPVAPALGEHQAVRDDAGIVPRGDAAAVLSALGPIGGEAGRARQPEGGRLVLSQAQGAAVRCPGELGCGLRRDELLGLVAEEADQRLPLIGDDGLQQRARGPRDRQEPGQRLTSRAGHGNHRPGG